MASRTNLKLGVVVHAFNPSTPQERKAKFKAILIYMFIQFQDSQNYRDLVSKQKKANLKS